MDRIQLKLLIFLMHLTYIFSIVVFPFKIPEEKEKTLRFSNDIHATTYLGEPEQLTNIFFTSEEFLYFLDSCKGYNNFVKNFSTYETSKFPIYVDDEDDESGKVRAYQVNETIYIYTDLELTQKEKISDFPFLIKEQNLKNQEGCVLLGILYRNKKDSKKLEINFIEQLKMRNLISSYSWTFKFNSENDGLLIIGGEPHTYDPSNYNESFYITTVPPIEVFPSSYAWNFTFHKIYSGEDEVEEINYSRLSFSINFFLGDGKYNKTIFNQYFKKYIEDKKCSFYYDSIKHCYYYCDKTKFNKKDIKSFPVLSLLNRELEMYFNFTGEDLFYETKDYYYFMIYFMNYGPQSWLIGQPFLRKYQLVFNHDQKTIGFYNYWRKEKKEEIKPFFSDDNMYLYLIIGLSVIVLIFIIFALTKFVILDICCQKRRKKLVNELDDENADYFDIEGKNKDNNPEDKKLYKTNETNE